MRTDSGGGFCTAQTGDVVQTFFYYAADDCGEWEDNILYRVDITND